MITIHLRNEAEDRCLLIARIVNLSESDNKMSMHYNQLSKSFHGYINTIILMLKQM